MCLNGCCGCCVKVSPFSAHLKQGPVPDLLHIIGLEIFCEKKNLSVTTFVTFDFHKSYIKVSFSAYFQVTSKGPPLAGGQCKVLQICKYTVPGPGSSVAKNIFWSKSNIWYAEYSDLGLTTSIIFIWWNFEIENEYLENIVCGKKWSNVAQFSGNWIKAFIYIIHY